MRRLVWLREHLPGRVWDNLATITILLALAIMSLYGWKLWDVSNSNHRTAHQAQQLARSNRARVVDIQASRIASCRQTYNSYLEVLITFFPKDPKTWTARQRKAWTDLEKVVSGLKARCAHQTRTKGGS